MQHTGVAIESLKPPLAAPEPSRLEIHRMFDRIARRYDLLNRIFSFGQDVVWRKKLARLLAQNKVQCVLDLATGTGDVVLSAFKHNQSMTNAVGLDMSAEMLEVGSRKLALAGLTGKILLVRSDALAIPMVENTFDATTISFGIRNVIDVPGALKEMYRVLRPDGKTFVLEFALPSNALLRKLFLIYLRNFIPIIGGYFSGNRGAYKYLNETVETFPYGGKFAEIMEQSGFKNVKIYRMTFGVAMIYEGTK